MKLNIQVALIVAALAMASTACSRDHAESGSSASASASGNDTEISTSAQTTSKDGVVEKVIERRIKRGFTMKGENLKMRDGKVVLTKDDKEIGTIAADGTVIIDGKAVALTADARATAKQLHAQALQLTDDAINIAGAATSVASTAVADGVKLAMSSILQGDDAKREAEFEQKIESTVMGKIKPAAIAICKSSNAMEASKQTLAKQVPEYAKYYTADKPCDVAEMERQFASTSEDHPASTQ